SDAEGDEAVRDERTRTDVRYGRTGGRRAVATTMTTTSERGREEDGGGWMPTVDIDEPRTTNHGLGNDGGRERTEQRPANGRANGRSQAWRWEAVRGGGPSPESGDAGPPEPVIDVIVVMHAGD